MSVRSLRLAVAVLSLFTLPLMADSFDVFTSGNWSNTATWYQNGVPATRYPGSLAGTVDTVTTTPPAYTVTVDVALSENVTMTTTCPSNTSTCVIDVTAGGLLKLTGGSSIGADAKLQLSGGTVLNAGMLSLAGTAKLDWVSGTLGGGGSTNASAGSNVNVVGPGNAVLDSGQTLSLFGTLTYSGGQFYQNGGADVVIKSGGLFDIQTINGIATDNGTTATLTVDAGGMLKKSGGAFGTNVDPMLFNNGTVRVDVASLVVSRGTHSGTFVMTNAGNGIGFGFPGTHTFNGTNTISGAGEAFFGGAVSISGTVSISNMENDGFASFSGTGTINLAGTWTWRGATVSGVTINASNTATVNITGENNVTLTANAHLNNQGTLDLNPGAGALTINSGGHITNDGDFNLLGDVTIFSNALSGARIDNLATRSIDKTSGASIATVNAVVNNSGNVNVTSGGLKLTRGGTHTGTWFTGSTSAIEFAGNTNQFLGGTITGTGTLGLSNGAMDVDVNLSVPAAMTFKQSGGTLTGSGNFTIDGWFDWTGGMMDNSSGNGQTIATAAPSIQIAPATGPVTLSGRTFVNLGTAVYTATAPNFLTINDGGTFLNSAGFTFVGDSQIQSNNVSSPRFVTLAGAGLNKSGGSGTAQMFVYVQNDGNIIITSGTLTLSGGGQHTGTVHFGGATNKLIIDNSVFGITAATNITTSGWVVVSGASARLALLAPLTLENLELLGGQIDSGALTVNTQMIWKAGQLGPGGSTTLSSATLDHSTPTGPTTIDSHSLNLNSSTYTYDGTTFPLTLANGATINNNSGSTFNSIGDGSVNSGAGSNNFNNFTAAFLRKTGGTSGTRFDVIVNNTGGTINSEVDGQSLILNGGGTMSGGQLQASGTALFDFFGGTFTYNGGFIGGSGKFRVLGTGTLKFASSAALTPPFELHTGGTIDVQSPSVVAFDILDWMGGTMTGAGQKRVMIGGAITNAGPSTLANGLFDVNGPVTYSGDTTNFLTLGGGTTFLIGIGGALDITTDGQIAGPGLLQNQGSLQKSAGGGTSAINAPISSAASGIDVFTGKLQFGGGGTISSTSIDIGGAQLEFAGGTMTIATGTILSGTGTVRFSGGITNIDVPLTLPDAAIEGGTLGGGANVTIDGGFWSSGTMNGSGTTIVGAGKTFDITGAGTTTLDRAFTNNGTLRLNTAAVVLGGTGTFTNNGTFAKNTGTGTTAFVPAFTNTNTVTLSSGTVAFNGGFTQSAGEVVLTGGNMGGSSVVINGGKLAGSGTVTANVTNNALVMPGLSPGALTIIGNYAQTSAGTLQVELAGTTAGTQYDQVNVSGTATLDGTLDVSFIPPYIPNGGETYDVLTFASKSGDFATKNLPAFPAGGSVVASYEPPASPTKLQLTALLTQADMTIAQTPSAPGVNHGDTVTFTVTVTNNGPATATGISLTDMFMNATFVSVTGPMATCSGSGPITCTIGTLAAGQSTTVTITLNASDLGTISNTANVTAVEFDPVTSNNGPNTATIFVGPRADLVITKSGPATTTADGTITYTITVSNDGPSDAANVVVDDPRPTRLSFVSNSGACTTGFPCSLGTMSAGVTKVITSTWHVAAGSEGSTITNTASVTSTTVDTVTSNNTSSTSAYVSCGGNSVPAALQPSGETVPVSGTLSWTGGSGSYVVYLGNPAAGCSTQFAVTNGNSVPYSLEPGTTYQWRVESVLAGCQPASSDCITFTTEGTPNECTVPQAPAPRVVGQTTSAKTYEVEWDAVPGATRYEIDEAASADFANATTSIVDTTRKAYTHDVTQATAFYYRVRAYNDCQTLPGANSVTVRVVIVPLPPKDEPQQEVNVPAGSTETIVQEIFIPGEPDVTLFFNATTDRPWLTVTPQNGPLPPQGVTLQVTADPKNLPNGTFTASLIVTITDSARGTATHGTTTTTIPLSINLVTPVSPVQTKPATSEHALIIPSVGHLDGIGSQWRSDIRITNAGFRTARYSLTFTPSGGTAQGVKQTTITVDAGATTALDDIVRNWYGIGSLGDSANGMLEIVPLDDPAATSLATVASSRTYNVTNHGTLGQFIPAIRANALIGKALQGALPQLLSLQQIAQNGAYRTNVGIAEGSGNPASVLLRIFNAAGDKLRDVPLSLAAGEQRQINSLLATQGIELSDGRVEVQVLDGGGKVTAYASVVDNRTNDPLLVAGTPLAQQGTWHWILPGAANLDNAVAHWRTDMRVFNYGAAPRIAELTFVPATGSGEQKRVDVNLGPGVVVSFDDVVRSIFGSENVGGAVHLRTDFDANLVVTGRTYNQTDEGTFGQFIPAVTSDDAIGAGERALQILQVEDSIRYRTNVGITETAGFPTTIEVQVYLPDSKVTPTVTIPLAPFEFRQFNVIRSFGLGNVYNARIAIRVVGGQGRVAAYGSVIDELTQDPTYVPAQK